MILDGHSHWLPEEIIAQAHFYSRAWGDIENQLAMMDEAGVDRAVLSYPTTDAAAKLGGAREVARIYNRTVSAITKRFPTRFVGAAILPIGDAQGMEEELSRATEELGFRALSLASSYEGIFLDDRMFWPAYEKAAALRLPVFVHPQIINPIGSERVQDPLLTPVMEYVFDLSMSIGRLLMGGVLQQFPEVAFVFANFGGVVPHLAHRFDETYQMLRGINFVKDLGQKPTEILKGIYLDTGGDKLRANFLSALELVGADHLVWGSDWPAKRDTRGSLQALEELGLSPEEKNKITGGNLEKLLKGA
jgi:aminocarboxymuconate-semialdehyde decarboxylase